MTLKKGGVMKKWNIIITMCSILFAWEDIPKEKFSGWMASSIGFEKNAGQVTDFDKNPVDYIKARVNLKGFSIFITDKGVSFVIYKAEKKEKPKDFRTLSEPKENLIHYARFDIELLNADLSRIEFEEELPGYTNYYYPSCPDGILFVKSYKKVKIKDVYPGIDWVFRIEDKKLHHEFEIEPYTDIREIKFRVKWADVFISEDGKRLVFKTPLGEIQDGEIYAYEVLNSGKTKPASVYYKKDKNGLIALKAKNYSGENPLIIDPPLSLLWATYYGGSSVDQGYSITTDGQGNVFVTGATFSIDFPTYDPGGGAYYQGTDEYEDAFVLKFETSIVGIEEKEDSKSFVSLLNLPIFFKNEIDLRFESSLTSPLFISLYDISGKLVYKKVLQETSSLIIKDENLKKLPSGIYFLNIKSGEKDLGMFKLIKD